MKDCVIIAVVTAALALPAPARSAPAPEGADVYFANPEDGENVQSPVTAVFGLSGMGVAPAGTEHENTGHHHLLIDVPAFGQGPDDDDMTENRAFRR